MSFSNPVTGGQGTLVRPAIKSPNYVAGVSGWTINRDGSAEFNNLTLRGTFTGTDYIINSAGEFFYSGSPALGNLIASITRAAGTDSFGNTYLVGVTVYDNTNQVFAQMNSGAINLGTIVAGVPNTGQSGFVIAGSDILQLTSPETNTKNQQANLRLLAGIFGSGIGSANVPFLKLDAGGSTNMNLGVPGAVVSTDPSTLTPATWQTPSYGAGFAGGSTASASYQALRFRLDAEDNVVLKGAFHFTAGAPANPVFTLPVGFRPTALWNSVPLWYTTAGTDNYNGAFRLQITAGGAVNYAAVTAPVANDNVYVDITLPLGNIA